VPEVDIQITGAEVAPYAAVPTLLFGLHITDPAGGAVHALSLRTQIRIEPQRRRYQPDEEDRLLELFGAPERWGQTLKPFLWTEVAAVVPAFQGEVDVELAVPCSYDLEVTANRYFHGLDEGLVPLVMFFSGTVFRLDGGRMSISPVSWQLECRYQMPVAEWRGVMDRYFPGAGWLRLRRDTIDALGRIKAAEALTGWDDVITLVLKRAGEDG
jgi:hypothetical protein